jgi:alkanesulfonate monooxygenase SsuD/methylene tetrahydromethanopterin reductase-like flavin-dependent oxidoreductase (luciferase family)
VDHEGRFFTLEGATPHIQPVQEPHPPIWVGGHSEAGARRAGRVGDGFVTPPGADLDEVAARIDVVRQESAARRRELGPMPLRRNIRIAASREQALEDYARVAGDRYRAYARRGLGVYGSHEELSEDFVAQVASHAVVGTPDEVAVQLRTMSETLGVDPIIVRCGWPSMTADETIEQVEMVGSYVIPGLAS